ncbi:hypothetical protein DEO72_LG10g3713 [Vigna unguiculata]|uniref:Ulp1 protease family n=1 Tax=Vigna unguiculata TaxID=3917 RepID=A0A4D6NIN6_VIGUN|nr:hypothetical protein DEO72_LG10g3713 [Vigna unguiculata]
MGKTEISNLMGMQKEKRVVHHDCGVLVLKFIEMWDGVSQFNGKALPDYTTTRKTVAVLPVQKLQRKKALMESQEDT